MRGACSPERAVGKFRDRFCPPCTDPAVDAVRFGDGESREPVSRRFPNGEPPIPLLSADMDAVVVVLCFGDCESRETVCLRLPKSEPPIDPLSA